VNTYNVITYPILTNNEPICIFAIVIESAKETAKQFGISYTLNVAWTLYERAREAAENSEPNSLRLQYRKVSFPKSHDF